MSFNFFKLFFRALALGSLSVAFAAHASPQTSPFKVIAFYSTKDVTGNGYLGIDPAHINFAHESNAFFRTFGPANGFTYDSTLDWTKVGDSAFLSKYNVVMWLDDQPGTAAEMTGFKKYMDRGGSLIAFHVCAYDDNSMVSWPWYFDTLLASGQFNNNTWLPTAAKMHIDDTSLSITKGLPTTFTSPVNEFYSFTKDVRKSANIKVLFSIDPSGFPVGTSAQWTSGYYPISWVNTKWKMVYDNMGHNNMNYSTNQAISLTWTNNPTHTQYILNALKWLAGSSATPLATPSPQKQSLKSEREMSAEYTQSGLTVSRPGAGDFKIVVTDFQGNILAQGRSRGGVYSNAKLHLGRGSYAARSTSQSGPATAVFCVLR